MTQIEFAIAHDNFVRIDFISRENANAITAADGQWLLAKISFSAGAFKGNFGANLNSFEIESFKEELSVLNQTLKGTAKYHAFEKQVIIELVGDGTGRIQFKGQLMDAPGTGNTLIFYLAMDQTYLGKILKNTQNVLEKFQVVREE